MFLISNVDDHLRNHGFLWLGKNGWSLSPAYDLNPVPSDIKARVLTTNISLDEATCSLDLLESAAEYFQPLARSSPSDHQRGRSGDFQMAQHG
jgi:serine/threonine-protein kinase HipA